MGVTWVLSFSLGKFQWGWVKHNPVRLSNFIDPHISEKTLALALTTGDAQDPDLAMACYGRMMSWAAQTRANPPGPPMSYGDSCLGSSHRSSLRPLLEPWTKAPYGICRTGGQHLFWTSRAEQHGIARQTQAFFKTWSTVKFNLFSCFFSYFFCNQNGQFEIIISFPLLDIAWQKKWNLHAESGLAPLIHWSLQASHCLRGACGAMRFLMLAFINGSMPKGWKCLGRPPRRALLQKGPWDIMGPVRSMLHHGTHLKHAENAA